MTTTSTLSPPLSLDYLLATDADDADTPITLTQAARLVPRRRGGRPCAVQTLHRWVAAGCRGVRLQYVQIGGTRCTTRRWLAEFFGALTARSGGGAAPTAALPQTSGLRSRELARIDVELAAAGI